jgi:UDP-N-acetylmuramoyl-tripeptide--D-alanyl-D-alanine ligase
MVQAARGRLIRGNAGGTLAGVSNNTRTIAPGELYVALRGEKFDGHRFCAEAIAKGAGGVLIQSGLAREMALPGAGCVIEVPDTLKALQRIARTHRRRFDVPVIAITGSNGKTSTKEMTAAILGTRLRTLKTEGNLNNLIGLPLMLLRLDATHDVAVLELGMNHRGEIRQMTRLCDPTIGVITNVGPAHIEHFRDVDDIARAKGELFRTMRPGTIVVNADDPRVVRQSRGLPHRRLSFGLKRRARIRAERITSRGVEGQTFTLVAGGRRTRVRLPAPGLHSVANALAAAGAAFAVGLGPLEVVEGLASFENTKWRMQIMKLGRNIILINDCYNANPASMEAALRSFAEMKGKARGFAILGDMLELGRKSEEAHRDVGRLVRDLEIEVLFTYGKAAEAIADEAASGPGETEVHRGRGHVDIVNRLRQMTRGKDWILVKGSRGMEMEKIVEGFAG